MTNTEILNYVLTGLNEKGSQFKLTFQVDKEMKKDEDWLQIFVSSNATGSNSAAERQIIADVEEDATKKSKQEILLVPVSKIADTG